MFSVGSPDPKFQALSQGSPKYYPEMPLNFLVKVKKRKATAGLEGCVCVCVCVCACVYVMPWDDFDHAIQPFGPISYCLFISLCNCFAKVFFR